MLPGQLARVSICRASGEQRAAAELVGVLDDQGALAAEQFAVHVGEPAAAAGGGVDHGEVGAGLGQLVHGADHREFADAGLALDGQPLARGVDRAHLVAAAQPQPTRADQAGQHDPRRRGGHRRDPGALLGQLDVHHPAGQPPLAAHRPAEHPGLGPAGQVDGERRGRVPPGQGLGGLGQQHGLLGRVEGVAGVVVHHHDVVVQSKDNSRRTAAGAQVLLQQLQLPDAAVGQQCLLDLPGGVLGQRHQQRVGVLAPAGEVDRADRLAGDRVVDRHARTGQVLEVLGVVLVAEHVHRPATLQGGADPVGADVLLGVAEAGRQVDPVQVGVEVTAGVEPGQHQPGLVGEDDADRLVVQVLAQVVQHRQGAADQRRVQVGVAHIGEIDPVGGDVPAPGSPPRGQDRVADLVGIDVLGGQELLAGPGQLVTHVERHRAAPKKLRPDYTVRMRRLRPVST